MLFLLPTPRSNQPPASIEEEMMLIRMPEGKAVRASSFLDGKETKGQTATALLSR